MQDTRIITIPRALLARLMEQRHDLSMGMLKLISVRRRRAEMRLKSWLFRSKREQLCSLMVELTDQHGVQSPKG